MHQVDNVLTTEDTRTKVSSVQNHVVRALEERHEQQEREATLIREGMQKLLESQAVAAEVKKAKVEKAPEKELDRAIEIITYDTTINKTVSAMRGAVLRQKAQATLAFADTATHIEHHGEASDGDKMIKVNLSKSVAVKQKEYDAAYVIVEAWVAAKEDEYKKYGENGAHTAPNLVEKLINIALDFKQFLTGQNEMVNLKTTVKSAQDFYLQTKKVIEKHVRETTKAKTQRGSLAALVVDGVSKLEKQLLERMAAPPQPFHQNYYKFKWNVKNDLIDTKAVEGAGVVVVPKDRVGKAGEKIRNHEYYGSQKIWSAETMTKGKLAKATTTIVKPAALRSFKASMQSFLGHELDLQATTNLAKVANLGEIFEPKFYQGAAKATSKNTSTDYGLVDFRLQLEGVEHIFGIPLALVPGTSLADQQLALGEFGVDDFLKKVAESGFYLRMVQDQACFIPGNFAIVTVAPDTVFHGIRMLVPGGPLRAQDTIGYLQNCVDTWPELKDSLHEHIAKYLEEHCLIDAD